ncbi:lanthionine synthetase LanC family protein [Emticicia sp. 17c]|uniref:lanthionine synthetase LanC family protein n=1 Tax=Emticicia sp. 17c TaxID=3127704 RepID=UPI00301DD592
MILHEVQTANKTVDTILALSAYIENNPTEYLNLTRGEIGKILYYFYASRSIPEKREEFLAKGGNLLSTILDIVIHKKNNQLFNSSLSNGLAGLGLTIEILVNEGFIEDDLQDFLYNIDKYVFENAITKIRKGNIDYLHGGGGAFHYLYYRIDKNPAIKAYLETFVEALEEIAVPWGEGIYFPNIYMKDLSRESEVNLGLSHGMVSTLLMLINFYEAGISPQKAEQLINKGITFMLSFRNTEHFETGEYYNFPNSIILNQHQYSPDNLKNYSGGLRWCYGDMNIMHLLYKAGIALNQPYFKLLADEIGVSTLPVRDIKQAHCHGSLFCHGATGIAYYYKYLARISGQQFYMEAYHYWLNLAFSLFDEEVEQSLFTEISGYFLEGFVGSSLVLMESLTDDEPYWEKVWLLA